MGEDGIIANFKVLGPLFPSNHFEEPGINHFCFSMTPDMPLTAGWRRGLSKKRLFNVDQRCKAEKVKDKHAKIICVTQP